MATIGSPATQPYSGPRITNPTYANGGGTTVIGLNTDLATVLGMNALALRTMPSPYTTWTTIKTFTGTGTIAGLLHLADGEVLVSLKISAAPGQVWKSTGWATNPASATWTQVLTCNGSDVYARFDAGRWGMSALPAGHPRAGLVALMEYGPQTASGTLTTSATKSYLSTDHGATFTTLLDLAVLYPSRLNTHGHGVALDPYADQCFITHGDNLGSASALVSTNFRSGSPTWQPVTDENGTFPQLTGVIPLPDCVLFTPDGAPMAIQRAQRLADGSVGTMRTAYRYGAGTGTGYIGGGGFQIRSTPGQPMFLNALFDSTATAVEKAAILATLDGYDFNAAWRENNNVVPDKAYFGVVVGPTVTGKIVATLFTDGRFANPSLFVADYVAS